MRLEKLATLMMVARELATNTEGLTLDEIASLADVGRRTAERMRDLIDQTFGPLESLEDGKRKRFRLASHGLGRFFSTPTSDELAELENAARQADDRKSTERAKKLRSLSGKIISSLRENDRRRLKVDTEALVSSETFTRYVGPHPVHNSEILSKLKQALLQLKQVSITYPAKDGASLTRDLTPYGILYGARYYLIGAESIQDEPKLFRLDRIKDAIAKDTPGAPPASFSLDEYVTQSFGVFHDDPEFIELLFDKSSAEDVLNFQFHPKQIVRANDDGTIYVSFYASGMLELARHLMTWGNTVTILNSKRLKDMMVDQIQKLYNHHRI